MSQGGPLSTTGGAAASKELSYSEFIVDPGLLGGAYYSTIEDATAAAYTAGGGTVLIKPKAAAYVEDLLIYDNVNYVGATADSETGLVVIQGKHSFSAFAGDTSFKNLSLTSATHIFDSGLAAASLNISLVDCHTNATSGYTFNLPNWTGSISAFNVTTTSTLDGFINNSGKATVTIDNAICGAGTANPMILSGASRLSNATIKCPTTINSTSVASISNGSRLEGTLTTGNSATVDIANTMISTGATQAITHNSTNALNLSNVSIDSSNDPAIGGTGSGAVKYNSVTYLDNANTAVTITKAFTGRVETGTLKANDSEAGIALFTAGVLSDGGGVLSQNQIYYVGKHGNDSNDGKSIGNALLTFGQAKILAVAASPTTSNRITILCLDDGSYTENIVCVSYVNIYAPNANLIGSITGADNSSITLSTQSATAITAISKTSGTGRFFCNIDEVYLITGSTGLFCTAGETYFNWKYITLDNGIAIGSTATAQDTIHLNGGDIYITGNGRAINLKTAGLVLGHIDRIKDIGGTGNSAGIFMEGGEVSMTLNSIEDTGTGLSINPGECNLTVQEIVATQAYIVLTPGELNLHVNKITGTETIGALATVRKVSAEGDIEGVDIGQTTPGLGEFSSLGVNGAFTFPTVDGTNGQVLQTNGSGVLSWVTP